MHADATHTLAEAYSVKFHSVKVHSVEVHSVLTGLCLPAACHNACCSQTVAAASSVALLPGHVVKAEVADNGNVVSSSLSRAVCSLG